jgi:hypothetical protein
MIKKMLSTMLKKFFTSYSFADFYQYQINRILPPESYSPACKAMQIKLISHYRNQIHQQSFLPHLNDTGFRIFSQNDEDGIILFLFAVIGAKTKLFVEIGTGNGTECNCANLAINLGWHGLYIDGNSKTIEKGRRLYAKHPDTWLFPPKFISAIVTRENINSLISEAGFTGGIDFLSIDIDGMDFWIWEAIDCINPRIVSVEVNGKFGMRSISVPYKQDWQYKPEKYPHYHGASLTAVTKLAKTKDYRLVGANRFGFNAFYLRNDICPDLLPEVSVESCRTHFVRNFDDEIFATISDLDYVEI